MVHSAMCQGIIQVGLVLQPLSVVRLAQFLARSIDIAFFARLGINHTHQSNVRQFRSTLVIDLYGHHIVFAIGNGQLLLQVVQYQSADCRHGSRASRE